MNNLLKFGGTFILLFFAISCRSGNSPDGNITGIIEGSVLNYDSDIPVEDITVYLINANAKVDTIDYNKNRKALVDSVKTDGNGVFRFAEVKAGYYLVTPLYKPDFFRYSFIHDESSDSYEINLKENEEYHIDFFAREESINKMDKNKFTRNYIIKPLHKRIVGLIIYGYR